MGAGALKKYGADVGTMMAAQSIYEQSISARHVVGTRLPVGERIFYYAHAATTIAAGQLCSNDQSVLGSALGLLPDASCCALAKGAHRVDQPAITAALAVNNYWLAVTHADMLDNVTKNILRNGYVNLTDSAGVDQIYRIKSNSVMASDIVSIELYDPIVTATADSTTGVTLMMSPFEELALADTDVDENPAGVPLIAITDNYYFWLQTWGPSLIVTQTDTAFGGTNIEMTDDAPGAVTGTDTGALVTSIGSAVCDVTAAGDTALVILRLYP